MEECLIIIHCFSWSQRGSQRGHSLLPGCVIRAVVIAFPQETVSPINSGRGASDLAIPLELVHVFAKDIPRSEG